MPITRVLPERINLKVMIGTEGAEWSAAPLGIVLVLVVPGDLAPFGDDLGEGLAGGLGVGIDDFDHDEGERGKRERRG